MQQYLTTLWRDLVLLCLLGTTWNSMQIEDYTERTWQAVMAAAGEMTLRADYYQQIQTDVERDVLSQRLDRAADSHRQSVPCSASTIVPLKRYHPINRTSLQEGHQKKSAENVLTVRGSWPSWSASISLQCALGLLFSATSPRRLFKTRRPRKLWRAVSAN